jgi:hypothetical protein
MGKVKNYLVNQPQKTEHKPFAKTNYAKHNLFVFRRKPKKSPIAKMCHFGERPYF